MYNEDCGYNKIIKRIMIDNLSLRFFFFLPQVCACKVFKTFIVSQMVSCSLQKPFHTLFFCSISIPHLIIIIYFFSRFECHCLPNLVDSSSSTINWMPSLPTTTSPTTSATTLSPNLTLTIVLVV